MNNVIEKKRKLEQELGRLKQHLVSIEESSTQDALANEDRERELRKKLQVCCQFNIMIKASHVTRNL